MRAIHFVIFFLSLATFCTIGAIFNLPVILAKIAIGSGILGLWVFFYMLGTKKLKP